VAEDEASTVCAYAAIRRTHALAIVAPTHERRGLGSELLGWVERRERELGRERHRQGAASANARARALLLDAGYSPERSYTRLRLELGQRPPGSIRTEARLRALELPGDARPVYLLDAESFDGHEDYVPMSFTAFAQEHLDSHDLAPELSVVAEHAGDVVGFLLALRWRETQIGFVEVLAVAPPYRGRGIGTAMLERAFARFAGDGLREAQLGVASTNPDAVRLYERLGMRPRFRIDTYERAVAAL
jgi:ribosomal protein S18 acetylase RimI-like enzyme